MFAAVYIKSSNVRLVVPIKWIHPIDIANEAKFGVNAAQTHIVYYSRDNAADADFGTLVKTEFDDSISGCYYGYINAYFGELMLL